jgi:hypothetical protein
MIPRTAGHSTYSLGERRSNDKTRADYNIRKSLGLTGAQIADLTQYLKSL